MIHRNRRKLPTGATALATTVLVTLAALTLSGCGQGRTADNQTSAEAGDPQASDYVVAPTVQTAAHAADGMVTLSGRAAPESIVRLSSPDGQSWGMTSGPDGAWTFSVPVGNEPRMLSLTAERAGRDIHAEGAVILLPGDALPAVIARSGYGAVAVATAINRPVIVALDFDSGGGAVASGMARPGAPIRLTVDEQPAGGGKADAQGRFSAPAVNRPITSGEHRIHVDTADGAAELSIKIATPQPLSGKAYRATREDGAWRLDWKTPGGGQQSTLIFDSAQQALTGTTTTTGTPG